MHTCTEEVNINNDTVPLILHYRRDNKQNKIIYCYLIDYQNNCTLDGWVIMNIFSEIEMYIELENIGAYELIKLIERNDLMRI